MRPPPGGTFPHSMRCSGPQNESTSSARRGRIGGIGPIGATAGGGLVAGSPAAAGSGAPPSPMAITALRQCGESAAAFACRQRNAAEPPGFTPGQCTRKSERQAARTAATCGELGFLPSPVAAAGPPAVGAAVGPGGGAAAPGGSSADGAGDGAAAAGAGFASGAGAAFSAGRGPTASSAALHDGDTLPALRETFQRFFAARLDPRALRHEIRAARGADR